MADLPFADRAEAGRLLGEELSRHKLGESPVVLALTRGGVPVGFEVADRLELPLDIIVARKIGVPWQPELAMGAIAGSIQVMEHRLIQQLGISEAEVEEVVERERTGIKRREELYRGGRPAIDLEGRTAIIVDDGLATGNTMLASVRYARTMKPARVIVAVPVGSREACALLRKEADENRVPRNTRVVLCGWRVVPQLPANRGCGSPESARRESSPPQEAARYPTCL